MSGPLSGLKVLDLTANFMGPYASLLLADMGADICKIEPPEGDLIRKVGPARHKGMTAIFMHLNRNKRSIVIDLKTEQGLTVLKHMIRKADVLMFSLRPAAMARLGLAYEQVAALNPAIIYCGAFGFGQNGPYADRAAYDNLIQAAVGIPYVQSKKTLGPPTYVGTAIVDRVVGMAMSNAILGALYCRAQTGKGQSVEVPMFETFAHMVMGDHMYGHSFVPPLGDWGYARMTDPNRKPYQTSDGYIAAEIVTDRHWQRLFEVIGRADLAGDPRYATVEARAQHMAPLYEILGALFITKPSKAWVELLNSADIAVMEMHTPATLLEDEHMQAVQFFPQTEHPTEGLIRNIGIPHRWSETNPTQRYPAPRLGEHTSVLLTEYGLSANEIHEVCAAGGVIDGNLGPASPFTKTA